MMSLSRKLIAFDKLYFFLTVNHKTVIYVYLFTIVISDSS